MKYSKIGSFAPRLGVIFVKICWNHHLVDDDASDNPAFGKHLKCFFVLWKQFPLKEKMKKKRLQNLHWVVATPKNWNWSKIGLISCIYSIHMMYGSKLYIPQQKMLIHKLHWHDIFYISVFFSHSAVPAFLSCSFFMSWSTCAWERRPIHHGSRTKIQGGDAFQLVYFNTYSTLHEWVDFGGKSRYIYIIHELIFVCIHIFQYCFWGDTIFLTSGTFSNESSNIRDQLAESDKRNASIHVRRKDPFIDGKTLSRY